MLGILFCFALIVLIAIFVAIACASKQSTPVVVTEKRTKDGGGGGGGRHSHHNRDRQRSHHDQAPVANLQSNLQPQAHKQKKNQPAGSGVQSKMVTPVGQSRDSFAKASKQKMAFSSEQDSINDTAVSAIKSTGSGYYAALMKQMKVKSVSQYGMPQ